MVTRLLPTSLVGSYAQPDWLIDRAKLAARFPPRVRARELWRIAPEWLEEAQDDATILAIRDQERAGLDIITDGEMRRESYSNRFATALEGVDIDNPGTALDRSGHPNPVPRIVGPIRRKHPVEVRDLQFLKANTDRPVKMTVPGPFTMSQQAQDDFYGSEEAAALGYAAAVNDEIKDLFAAGADVVQLDEPYLQARPDKARAYGLSAIARALDGVTGTTALHICFGYAAIIHDRPEGYSFLPELAATEVDQISVETAQSNLDTTVLRTLTPEDDHRRRPRSRRPGRRDRRGRRRRGSAGPSPTSRPSGSSWRRTAASSTCRATSPSPRCGRWSRARRSCATRSRTALDGAAAVLLARSRGDCQTAAVSAMTVESATQPLLPAAPPDWQLVATDGPGPFVTRATYRRPDGVDVEWTSRRHRKGQGLRLSRTPAE